MRKVRLKEGASLVGLQIEMRQVLIRGDAIYHKHGEELWITSGTEGEHSPASLHPFGYALDLRTRFFGIEQTKAVAGELREALPNAYDVVLHEGSHIHVEYDLAKEIKRCCS